MLRSLLCLSALSVLLPLSAGRGPDWRPERLLGSARLELAAIRTIVVPATGDARLEATVADFQSLWAERVGIGLNLERPSEAARHGEALPPKQAIVLERDARFAVVGPTGLDQPGAFRIEREGSRVWVRAADAEGLGNGLYAIAGELLGARWYWPGELGFEWVGAVPRWFLERIWAETPAFVQRTLYPVETDYGRRNRLVRRFSFNHNLARIFSPEVFATDPEVFPIIKGERRAPDGSARNDAQPDFTHPRTVELTVAAVQAHFAENPESRSFSLSVNDNTLFDESAATARAVAGGLRALRTSNSEHQTSKAEWGASEKPWSAPASRRFGSPAGKDPEPSSASDGSQPGEIGYFRGRPNYTDLVFGFMNEVAARVFEEGDGMRDAGAGMRGSGYGIRDSGCAMRDFRSLFSSQVSALRPLRGDDSRRYLTALAYYWTEQSPSFELHPQVMPVLTSDRAQWHDPAYRAQDKALIERWAASGAERIATWDYYFGAPYPYPRQFTEWMVESIRFLADQGVDVFFSQLPAMWGHDGPKAWLAAELLWDPDQDAGALLAEYYQAFFGAAAEPIRAFYERAEAHRNAHAGRADWIKYYKDEAGIVLFGPELLTELRGHLDAAAAAVAGDPRRAARVAVVSEAFELTERYAAYHAARVALLEQAGTLLPRAVQRYVEARDAFDARAAELVAQPEHAALRYFLRVKQTDPLPLRFVDWAQSRSVPLSCPPEPWQRRKQTLSSEEPTSEKAALEQPKEFGNRQLEIENWESARYAAQWAIAETLAAQPAAFRSMVADPTLQHAGEPVAVHFLGPVLPVVPGWLIDYRPTERLAVTAAADGAGYRVSGADMFSIFRDFPVVGGRDYALKATMAWAVSPDNRTQLRLTWKDREGKVLRVDLPLQLPHGRSEGAREFVYPVKAPNGAYDLRVHFTQSRQAPGDLFELYRVDFGLVAE